MVFKLSQKTINFEEEKNQDRVAPLMADQTLPQLTPPLSIGWYSLSALLVTNHMVTLTSKGIGQTWNK